MYNIAVIGCGAIGLTSALAIQNKFKNTALVTIYAKDISPDTTSDIAAGLWMPYLLQNTPEEKVNKWAKATQDYILKLWKQGKAKEAGISLQHIIDLSDEDNFKIPKWVKESTIGYHQYNENQLSKFKKLYNKKLTGGYGFVGFIWEGSIFLPYLMQIFLENGGVLKMCEIKSLDDLPHYDVIVNCTGLDSQNLVNDKKVEPIRGQIARVKAPWQFHTQMFHVSNGNYVIPNQNFVILGGTRQKNNYCTRTNENDSNFIFKECINYVPSLKHAKIITELAGLRPARDEVRVELEFKKVGKQILRIVHNYGHGGSGITLCIGCAKDAVKLVEKAIQSGVKNKM